MRSPLRAVEETPAAGREKVIQSPLKKIGREKRFFLLLSAFEIKKIMIKYYSCPSRTPAQYRSGLQGFCGYEPIYYISASRPDKLSNNKWLRVWALFIIAMIEHSNTDSIHCLTVFLPGLPILPRSRHCSSAGITLHIPAVLPFTRSNFGRTQPYSRLIFL